jgi:hypothetical protein
MKFSLRLFPFFVLCCFVCLSAIPASADSVYQVTGALTIVGNDVCNGVPCVETLAFSFDVAWVPVPDEGYNPVILPNPKVTSFGPLGSFFLPTGSIGVGTGDYIPITDGQRGPDNFYDEIDIYALNAPIASSPQPLQLEGATLYSCGTAICSADFVSFANPGEEGLPSGGPLVYSETAVPEASALWYLLIGVGLILLTVAVRRRKTIGERADAPTPA